MPFRRWNACLLFLWAFGLVAGAGCATMPFGNRLASEDREPVVSKKIETASDARESDIENETSEAKSQKVKSKPSSRERPPAIAGKPSATQKNWDPATRMLVDSELKDLPAEERQQWKSYLAGVETSQIPHVLQNRAEGIVPSEMESVSRGDQTTGSSRMKVDGESTGLLSENAASELDTADASSPQETEADLQQVSDETVVEDSLDTQPIVEIGLEPDDAHDTATLSADIVKEGPESSSNRPEPSTEKRTGDGVRIWPQGKRGERSLSNRISGGHLPPLTPPWSRDPRTGDEKATKAKIKVTAEAESPQSPAAIDRFPRTDAKADYWQDELRRLISLMEAEASRPPADDSPAEQQAHIQRQVYLRMLYLMAAEPEKAQLPISDVDAVDEEFWTSMFWGMSNYFDDEQTADPGTRAAQTIAQLNSAARKLQSVADLELRNVSFCQQIDGWGLYERFDRDEFEPGQEVLLYGELRNFNTEATAAGLYRTLINSTIEIVRNGQEDNVLERNDLGDTEDQCRGLRTDFYNSYRLTIPAHLTRGSYQLRLTVEDKLTGRFATQTIGFTVQ